MTFRISRTSETISRLSSVFFFRSLSTALQQDPKLRINGVDYKNDEYTNITRKVISHMNKNLHLQEKHPLWFISRRIVNYFYSNFTHRGHPAFSVHDNLQPIVTIKQNFDDLLIPQDHPSRAKSDCYYVNKELLLRAHMTAHQSDLLKSGLDNFLMIGDVYRRDEIDATHYPVFHQLDAVRTQRKTDLFHENSPFNIFVSEYRRDKDNFKNVLTDNMKQACHSLEATKLMEAQLKNHLSGLVKTLFGPDIKYRWVDAYFPFTHPSWELEIFYENDWMEVLGCGICRNEILVRAGINDSIAYAFGLGLERLAMALYKIPDIRLMWSTDPGFLSQFQDQDLNSNIVYKPVSIYPPCKNDISFYLPPETTVDSFVANDFYDLVRNIGGDVIEQVKLKDKFIHPKLKKHSLCFTIVYRHLERTLTQSDVNDIHKEIEKAAQKLFNVTIR